MNKKDWKVQEKKVEEILQSKYNSTRKMPRVTFPKEFRGSIQWVE